MIRTDRRSGIGRRTALRYAFLGALSLAGAEVLGSVVPFMQVRKIVGLGVPVNVGPKSDVLAAFAESNDTPILFRQGHFFLIHPPGGIIAAYRKCTHLGCAVPWSGPEDRFHCPCHQSQYDKHTAVVLYGPAPKPLQLFHISDTDSGLVVDTNPLNVIDRRDNRWDPAVIEIADS
jgi:nitrite reductase/ring-hydroxylating ferredoxin subunit